MQLEEEQRRLLGMIQGKMQVIARLEEGKPLNDSTLEMTMRDSKDNRDRGDMFEKIVGEKEREI